MRYSKHFLSVLRKCPSPFWGFVLALISATILKFRSNRVAKILVPPRSNPMAYNFLSFILGYGNLRGFRLDYGYSLPKLSYLLQRGVSSIFLRNHDGYLCPPPRKSRLQ